MGVCMVLSWVLYDPIMALPWFWHCFVGKGFAMVLALLRHGFAMGLVLLRHGFAMVLVLLRHGLPWF